MEYCFILVINGNRHDRNDDDMYILNEKKIRISKYYPQGKYLFNIDSTREFVNAYAKDIKKYCSKEELIPIAYNECLGNGCDGIDYTDIYFIDKNLNYEKYIFVREPEREEERQSVKQFNQITALIEEVKTLKESNTRMQNIIKMFGLKIE